MIAPHIDYPDFFLRALVPGVHYVELNSSNLCEDTVSARSTPLNLHAYDWKGSGVKINPEDYK